MQIHSTTSPSHCPVLYKHRSACCIYFSLTNVIYTLHIDVWFVSRNMRVNIKTNFKFGISLQIHNVPTYAKIYDTDIIILKFELLKSLGDMASGYDLEV